MRDLRRAWSCVGVAGMLSTVPSTQGPPQLYPGRYENVAVEYPETVLFEDLDRDGNLDVLVGSPSDGIRVLMGDGFGGLVLGQKLVLSTPTANLGLGDLDQDGDLDLAVSADGWYTNFHVWWGDGVGGFTGPAQFPSGGHSDSLQLADMNGDGDLDVVLGNPGVVQYWVDQTVSIVFGDGAGGFSLPVVHRLEVRPLDLAVTDLDCDGDPDVVAVGWYGIAMLINDGQGGVERQLSIEGLRASGDSLASGDLNADGIPDVVVVGAHADFSLVNLYLGLGNGSLGFANSHRARGKLRDVALGDVDGDGLLDVCSGNAMYPETAIVVLHGDGLGGVVDEVAWPSPYPSGIALGDLDEDGWTDLAAASGLRHLLILANDGQGNLLGPRTLAAPDSDWLGLGDMNDDGVLDLVASSQPLRQVTVFPGQPAGSFGEVILSQVSFRPRSCIVAEMTGDSHVDLIANDAANGDFVLLEGDGQGHVTETGRWSSGSWPNRIAVVDCDRDGALDVVLANQSSDSLHVWRGDDQGGFAWVGSFPVGPKPTSVAAGDFDRDGIPDLALTLGGGDSVGIVLGDGQGGFGVATTFPCSDWPSAVVVADLNADTRLDVVTASPNGPSTVSVLLGDGSGGLSAACSYRPGMDVRTVAVADVTGDGVSDLVAAGGALLAVYEGDGTGAFSWAGLYAGSGSESGESIVVSDFDRDGRMDLAALTTGSSVIFDNLLADLPACTNQTVYCAAKQNSAGCVPRMCSSGSPTLSGPDDFVLAAESVLANQYGLLLWSRTQTALPFHGGLLCVGAPLERTPVQSSGGNPGAHDCSGSYAWLMAQAYMAMHGLAPGDQFFGQYWSRDPYFPPPFGSGLTDALRVTVEP